jgi:hypothetical protein
MKIEYPEPEQKVFWWPWLAMVGWFTLIVVVDCIQG